MTMFYNEASQMDPHVSCLVDPITILDDDYFYYYYY